MKFVLVGPARTGSNLLLELFYAYARKRWAYRGNLHEMFNRSILYEYEDTGDGIIRDAVSREAMKERMGFFEYRRRLALLTKYKDQNYALKILDNQMSWGLRRHFRSAGYRYILLERRDLLDQVLSLYLAIRFERFSSSSRLTQAWTGYTKLHAPIKELEIYRRYLTRECRSRMKRLKPVHATVYYEDFAFLEDKLEALDLMGFSDWRNYLDHTDPVVVAAFQSNQKLSSKESKLSLLENQKEVLDWYYSAQVRKF